MWGATLLPGPTNPICMRTMTAHDPRKQATRVPRLVDGRAKPDQVRARRLVNRLSGSEHYRPKMIGCAPRLTCRGRSLVTLGHVLAQDFIDTCLPAVAF